MIKYGWLLLQKKINESNLLFKKIASLVIIYSQRLNLNLKIIIKKKKLKYNKLRISNSYSICVCIKDNVESC